MTTISISDLQISCVIGVLKHERITKQMVSVDLEVTFDGRSAATSESIELTHDYSDISSQIEFILSAGEFMLIESAAHLILRHLLLPPTDRRPQISTAKVKITKADALDGTALAAVTIQGNGAGTTYTREEKSWGYVDIIEETTRLGLYRLTLAPLATLPPHYHQQMAECELMMSDGLLGLRKSGKSIELTKGERFSWKKNQVHGYTNTGSEDANILCMDRPSFIPEDEIEITTTEGSR
jgi:dihydroneopterin aldolase